MITRQRASACPPVRGRAEPGQTSGSVERAAGREATATAGTPVIDHAPAGSGPSTSVVPADRGYEADLPDLDRILADPAEPALYFQPIVDLQRGVIAGYEALARFHTHPTHSPDRVFAAADRRGLAAELEARVLTAALAARDRLPDRCFLAVNVLPHLLDSAAVTAVWRDADLRQVVLELNEAVDLDNTVGLTAIASELRNRGAFIAMDDVGSGYAGLRQLARVRPDFVKLDRSLVENVDDDQVKIALTELVGSFASRLNGWVIAEGVERVDELAMLVGLGVPLGQGFLLGRPARSWQQLDPTVARRIRQLSERSNRAASVESLMERVNVSVGDSGHCAMSPDCPSCPMRPSAAHGTAAGDPAEDQVADRATIIVSNRCRPVALHLAAGPGGGADPRRVPTTLFARPEEPVTEVARRAMTRARASRFDPVIIVTEMGRPLGLVRMERLMLRLAEMST
ncbi:EAL domain-containing protein [Frankia sp. AgKG'84/4]|uniref:EAL domain-containing protein n=1 Tax=Frankia sp. AgKG'84/4 TaxID=573490 RepID=UPI00200C1B13|nr:EAL domain-containing protein [Frankia sp. AgKG'84/4]MCL9793907.1 EAL domain-containing protein [Frankia sp. AgKG'84/4]